MLCFSVHWDGNITPQLSGTAPHGSQLELCLCHSSLPSCDPPWLSAGAQQLSPHGLVHYMVPLDTAQVWGSLLGEVTPTFEITLPLGAVVGV